MGCGASSKAAKVEAKPASEAPAVVESAVDAAPKNQDRPEVPPKKLMAIRDAFQAIDLNKSGRIQASELKTLLAKLGKDDMSDEEREECLKAMDKDGSKDVCLGEFVEWVMAKEGTEDAVAHWSSNKGLSDVHKAAIAGDADKVKSLIEAGGQVNARDVWDVTPLHYAARVGKAEAAKTLLAMKADVSAITSDTKRMPLHAAADSGSVDVAELLLAAGAQLDALDVKERTPLHWACCSSREEVAAVLLKAGADVNLKSSAGYTPFAFAQDWSTYQLSEMVAAKGGTR